MCDIVCVKSYVCVCMYVCVHLSLLSFYYIMCIYTFLKSSTCINVTKYNNIMCI